MTKTLRKRMGVRFMTIADCGLRIAESAQAECRSRRQRRPRRHESSIRNPQSAIASPLYRRRDDEGDADDDGADDDAEGDVLVLLDLLADGEGRSLGDDDEGEGE